MASNIRQGLDAGHMGNALRAQSDEAWASAWAPNTYLNVDLDKVVAIDAHLTLAIRHNLHHAPLLVLRTVGPGIYCSPRCRMPSDTRSMRVDDVANSICQALPGGHREVW